MVVEPKYENTLSVGTLTKTLNQVAQEGMLRELPKNMRELVLNGVEDLFNRGLTSEPPALITPTRLRWKPAVRTVKA